MVEAVPVTDYAGDCDPLRRRGPGAPVLFNADWGLKKKRTNKRRRQNRGEFL